MLNWICQNAWCCRMWVAITWHLYRNSPSLITRSLSLVHALELIVPVRGYFSNNLVVGTLTHELRGDAKPKITGQQFVSAPVFILYSVPSNVKSRLQCHFSPLSVVWWVNGEQMLFVRSNLSFSFCLFFDDLQCI